MKTNLKQKVLHIIVGGIGALMSMSECLRLSNHRNLRDADNLTRAVWSESAAFRRL